MNVKVKFTEDVINYCYWGMESLGNNNIAKRHKGVYTVYCESMLSTFDDTVIPELVAELGKFKFQWTYYVTMPREKAFRLQLQYSQYIDQVRT